MKIWLDDEREAPPGWLLAKAPHEVIGCLRTYKVEIISLDHDLGEVTSGTGYDVIVWIEKEVVTNGYIPPEIRIHTTNPVARLRMEAGVRFIKNYVENHLNDELSSGSNLRVGSHLLDRSELRMGKPARSEFKYLRRNPLHLVLDGVSSASNIGNIFRLADAVIAEKIWMGKAELDLLTGGKFKRASKSMLKWVPIGVYPVAESLRMLRLMSIRIIAVELVAGGQSLSKADLTGPVAFVLGNERKGISDEALNMSDDFMHLPMLGMGNSINVATAAAAASYLWLKGVKNETAH
ncbi:MAG: hypothetical protein J0L75_03775 [Spirochaetes bacterium]|nr:hypothetical protein [Spirochaetota bacterium]